MQLNRHVVVTGGQRFIVNFITLSSPRHDLWSRHRVPRGDELVEAMTKLSTKPLIHPTAHVRDCRFGAYTEIGARTRLLEVAIGDYSYVVNDSEMTYTTVGKFCSIAAMTRINPGNHPMD